MHGAGGQQDAIAQLGLEHVQTEFHRVAGDLALERRAIETTF